LNSSASCLSFFMCILQPARSNPARRPYRGVYTPMRGLSATAIVLGHERFGRNPPPGALEEIRQGTRIDGGETHQNPRVVPIMVRDEEDVRIGLYQDLTVQEIRAKNQAFAALVQPRKELAADLERRCSVRCGVLDARQGPGGETHLREGDRAGSQDFGASDDHLGSRLLKKASIPSQASGCIIFCAMTSPA
jgi:hypothetical protein